MSDMADTTLTPGAAAGSKYSAAEKQAAATLEGTPASLAAGSAAAGLFILCGAGCIRWPAHSHRNLRRAFSASAWVGSVPAGDGRPRSHHGWHFLTDLTCPRRGSGQPVTYGDNHDMSLGPVGEVQLRYRRADGEFADTTLEREAVDDLVAGLPIREFRWYRGRRRFAAVPVSTA
jgi:hypothetical protein